MQLTNICKKLIELALAEDIGGGDISAALIAKDHQSTAKIICKQDAVIAGLEFINYVFTKLGGVTIKLLVADGDTVAANTAIAQLHGNTQNLLKGERTALNFLQTISATATTAKQFLDNSKIAIYDTRKTIPGLRYAQKYAVRLVGGNNHRLGLYDAYLLKENHIMALGGIANAINAARKAHPDKTLEIEVSTMEQLRLALAFKADIIMLDNFAVAELEVAADLKNKVHPSCLLEYSGNLHIDKIQKLSAIAIDYISIGALTKNISAIDLSMLIV